MYIKVLSIILEALKVIIAIQRNQFLMMRQLSCGVLKNDIISHEIAALNEIEYELKRIQID